MAEITVIVTPIVTNNEITVTVNEPAVTEVEVIVIPEITQNKGDKGEKGDRGERGLPGEQGDPGLPGEQGNNGYTPIKGIDYVDGLPGADGNDGYTPIKGVDYSDGVNGYTPIKGIDYFDGLPGEPGYTPIKGVDYFDGAKGDPGEPGLPGEKGDTGERGLQGIQGIHGIQGERGDPGETGLPGSDVQVTKANVEAVLTGEITTHSHPGGSAAWGGISGTLSNQTDLQNALNAKADVLTRSTAFVIESDFYSANALAACPGLLGAATSSGTAAAVAADPNHPGVLYLRDSTTANGNYRYLSDITAFRISGGEKAIFVFKPRSVRSTASFRMGWQDSNAIQTQPTDGVWFQSVSNGSAVTILGRCKNNAGPTDTQDAFTLSTSSWYTGIIEINAAATLVTFSIYSDAGDLLWQRTVNANIPTAAGRETGFGIIAGETSNDAAAEILHIDYLRMEINRTLVR